MYFFLKITTNDIIVKFFCHWYFTR